MINNGLLSKLEIPSIEKQLSESIHRELERCFTFTIAFFVITEIKIKHYCTTNMAENRRLSVSNFTLTQRSG